MDKNKKQNKIISIPDNSNKIFSIYVSNLKLRYSVTEQSMFGMGENRVRFAWKD